MPAAHVPEYKHWLDPVKPDEFVIFHDHTDKHWLSDNVLLLSTSGNLRRLGGGAAWESLESLTKGGQKVVARFGYGFERMCLYAMGIAYLRRQSTTASEKAAIAEYLKPLVTGTVLYE